MAASMAAALTVRLRALRRPWSRLHGESGQGLVEYALIIVLVSLGAVVGLGFLSGKINALFSKSGNSVNNVAIGAPVDGGPVTPPCADPCGWVGGSGSPDNGEHINGTIDNFWLDGSTVQHYDGVSAITGAQPGIYDNNGSTVGSSETQGFQHTNGQIVQYNMNGGSFTCRWHPSSGAYAGWWFVVSPTPHPHIYPQNTNGTFATQATFEWGCWPDGDMTDPTADTLAISNGGGTNNRMGDGDTMVIGFSEAIDPNSICPEGWNGSARSGTVTIEENSGNDDLSFNILNNCSENVGGIDLGSDNYTTNTETFNATFALSGSTFTITVGSLTTGPTDSTQTNPSSGSATFTATYDPDNDIADLAGNNVNGSDTASNNAQHF